MSRYYFCDITISITDAAGNLVKESSYENVFIAVYWEKYDDEQGHGKFYAVLSERAVVKKAEKKAYGLLVKEPKNGIRIDRVVERENARLRYPTEDRFTIYYIKIKIQIKLKFSNQKGLRHLSTKIYIT